MNPTAHSSTGRSRAVRILIAGLLPLVMATAGATLIWLWRPDLPARVATHWGSRGADGFGDPAFVGLLLVAVGAVLALIGGGLGLLARDQPGLARAVTATAAGTAGFVAGLVTGSIAAQRGLNATEVSEIGLSGWAMLLGVVVAGGGMLIALLVVRTWPIDPAPLGVRAETLRLRPDERAVWTRSVGLSRAGGAMVLGSIAVTTLVAVILAVWPVLIVTFLLGLAAALALSVRVLVDTAGVTIRGRFGWPRTRVPLEEIAQASTTQVRPLRDFGGFGYRICVHGPLRGAHGIILRPGPALVVDRRDGRRLVVVVDDAQTAAALITSLKSRAG